MSNSRRFLIIVLILVSLGLLIPGITLPMFTLTGSLERSEIAATATDFIIDAMVERALAKNDKRSETEIREQSQKTISGMLNMFGLNELTGEIEAHRKTRSILGTVRELFTSGHRVVGFLVMLFSVIIPTIKILLLLFGSFTRRPGLQVMAFAITRAISKWSMADVFVVAVIVAYLAANASRDMGELMRLHAQFESGFYFFLGYCLFSIASSQLTGAMNSGNSGAGARDD